MLGLYGIFRDFILQHPCPIPELNVFYQIDPRTYIEIDETMSFVHPILLWGKVVCIMSYLMTQRQPNFSLIIIQKQATNLKK